MIKKSIVSIVSIALALNLTVSVAFAADTVFSKKYEMKDGSFSAEVNLTIDKVSVKPGESFTFTLSADNISNADKVTFKNLDWTFADSVEKGKYKAVAEVPVVKTADHLKPRMVLEKRLKIEENSLDSYMVSDLKVSLTFNVKNDAEPTKLTFSNIFTLNDDPNNIRVNFDPVEINISNEDTPAEPPATETSYTVSAKPSAESVYVGDTIKVDVVASADKAADLAAVDAVLNYDKDLVKPTGAKAGELLNKGEVPLYGKEDGKRRIAVVGDKTSVDDKGLVVATYEFEALKTGDATFSISDAKVGATGNPTDIDAKSGDPVSVEIKEIPDEKQLISNDTYKGAPTGKQVLKYIAKAMPAEGNTYFYGDDALYYAGEDADGKHVFLGFVNKDLTNETVGDVAEKVGTIVALSDSGDLNGNESVNAIDALIAYDLASGIYSDDANMSKLSAKARLEADINRDGKVDAADARAIVYKALGMPVPSTEPSEDQAQ